MAASSPPAVLMQEQQRLCKLGKVSFRAAGAPTAPHNKHNSVQLPRDLGMESALALYFGDITSHTDSRCYVFFI